MAGDKIQNADFTAALKHRFMPSDLLDRVVATLYQHIWSEKPY